MIVSVNLKKDDFLEKAYEKSMEELDEFFKINWVKNTPNIMVVPNRKTINQINKYKTEDWVVGWTEGVNIYLLDRKNYEKESRHRYSDEEYIALLKHELTHLFTGIFCNYKNIKPAWIDEGISIYLSGQNKFKKTPKEFKKFLTYYDCRGKEIYNESGFVVEFLIKNYGKEKFLILLKDLMNLKTKKEFEKKFYDIYGFELDYESFNKHFNEGKISK